MKTIANLGTLIEAKNLRTLMISEGIEAFIPDESKLGSVPHPVSSHVGIRLQVEEVDEDRAIEILNDAFAIAA